MRLRVSSRKFFLGVSSAALLGVTATPALADNHGKKMTTAELNKMSATQTANNNAENTVLQDWAGPYDGVPPWDEVKVSDFPAAFQTLMDDGKKEAEAILGSNEPATFDNFMIPWELAGAKANEVFALWGVHSSNLSNDEVRKVQGEWLPKISAFFNELQLDPRLFAKTKQVYDNLGTSGLNAQQKRLVTRQYESLVRNGALLEGEQKEDSKGVHHG